MKLTVPYGVSFRPICCAIFVSTCYSTFSFCLGAHLCGMSSLCKVSCFLPVYDTIEFRARFACSFNFFHGSKVVVTSEVQGTHFVTKKLVGVFVAKMSRVEWDIRLGLVTHSN